MGARGFTAVFRTILRQKQVTLHLMLSFRLTGLVAVCLVFPLLSQTSAPPAHAADAVIRVSVNLVEVDAMVTDSKGNHVSDLKPEDFTILEDGKPQKITQFAYVNPEPSLSTSLITVKTPGSFAPAVVPRREDVHRTIVLMVDNLHMHPDSIGALEPVLKKFVEEHVSAGDLVSVMGTRSGRGLYESFTSDKRQ
jgi:VWFA-related protein